MIQVLNRAINILELLASDASREFPLAEIASTLDMDKGTCANILKTLRIRGYVTQPGARKGYKMGYMVYRLSDSFFSNDELVRLSAGTMDRLSLRFNECVLLSVIRQDKRIVLYNTSPERDLVVRTSREKTAYTATTGRMILSYYSNEELLRFTRLYGLPKAGDWENVTSFSEMLKELEQAQKKGWRIDVNRNHIVGLAVPVWKGDKVIASLGIYLPEVRLSETSETTLLSAMKDAAEQLRIILSQPIRPDLSSPFSNGQL